MTPEAEAAGRAEDAMKMQADVAWSMVSSYVQSERYDDARAAFDEICRRFRNAGIEEAAGFLDSLAHPQLANDIRALKDRPEENETP